VLLWREATPILACLVGKFDDEIVKRLQVRGLAKADEAVDAQRELAAARAASVSWRWRWPARNA
jgi:hypothetical protein